MNLSHPSKLLDGVHSPKLKREWNEFDEKITQLNTKAMNILYCSLDANKFNHISTCNSA